MNRNSLLKVEKDKARERGKPSLVKLPDSGFAEPLAFLLKAGPSAQLFVDYLETEYSVENILFWREVEDFRSKHSRESSDLEDNAKKIYEQYISNNAPQQVNISADTRDQVAEDLAKGPTANIFDKAQKNIYDLMKSDAFPRFQSKSADMLTDSWVRMVQKGVPHVGYSFYGILFDMCPAAEGLFPGGLKAIEKGGKESQMLVTMVDTCVNLLQDLQAVVSILRGVARRHLRYGVKFEHFALVGTAFLKMVEKEDRANWDTKLETAWSNLYQIMSGMMVAAMSEAHSAETFMARMEEKARLEIKQQNRSSAGQRPSFFNPYVENPMIPGLTHTPRSSSAGAGKEGVIEKSTTAEGDCEVIIETMHTPSSSSTPGVEGSMTETERSRLAEEQKVWEQKKKSQEMDYLQVTPSSSPSTSAKRKLTDTASSPEQQTPPQKKSFLGGKNKKQKRKKTKKTRKEQDNEENQEMNDDFEMVDARAPEACCLIL